MYTVSGTSTLFEVVVLPLENEGGDVSRKAQNSSKFNGIYCTDFHLVGRVGAKECLQVDGATLGVLHTLHYKCAREQFITRVTVVVS